MEAARAPVQTCITRNLHDSIIMKSSISRLRQGGWCLPAIADIDVIVIQVVGATATAITAVVGLLTTVGKPHRRRRPDSPTEGVAVPPSPPPATMRSETRPGDEDGVATTAVRVWLGSSLPDAPPVPKRAGRPARAWYDAKRSATKNSWAEDAGEAPAIASTSGPQPLAWWRERGSRGAADNADAVLLTGTEPHATD